MKQVSTAILAIVLCGGSVYLSLKYGMLLGMLAGIFSGVLVMNYYENKNK